MRIFQASLVLAGVVDKVALVSCNANCLLPKPVRFTRLYTPISNPHSGGCVGNAEDGVIHLPSGSRWA